MFNNRHVLIILTAFIVWMFVYYYYAWCFVTIYSIDLAYCILVGLRKESGLLKTMWNYLHYATTSVMYAALNPTEQTCNKTFCYDHFDKHF